MRVAIVKTIIELVEQGDLHRAVDILLNYYDKSYTHSASKHKIYKPTSVSLPSAEAGENATILINKVLEISA